MTEQEHNNLLQRVVACTDEPEVANPLIGENPSERLLQELVNTQRAHAKEIKQLKLYINALRQLNQIDDLKVFTEIDGKRQQLKIKHISEARGEAGKQVEITVCQ